MIEASGLRFAYRRSPLLIDDLYLRFEQGELVALTGVSGRGKSTLLYILGLMLRPLGGCVRIDGIDTSRLRDADLARLRARSFGFLFQDAALDASRTVLDNVVEGALYRGQPRRTQVPEALELLREFGVAVDPASKPAQVSGGQAQRIALCRALVSSPSAILADEPTGNLDGASAATVIDGLAHRAALGATVIIATHDPSVIARCDREVRL